MLQIVFTSTALLGILSLCLGVWSIVKNPKSRVIQLWFLLCLAVTIWCTGYFWNLKSTMGGYVIGAGASLRVVYIGALLIPVLFHHFIAEFLFISKKNKNIIILSYIVAFILCFLTFGTSVIIQGVTYTKGFGYHENVGSLFPLFLCYFFLFPVLAFIYLIKAYQKADGIRKRQILFLILSVFVGFIGGGTNFLTDYFGIFPYGQMVVFLYPILITYGIFMPNVRVKN